MNAHFQNAHMQALPDLASPRKASTAIWVLAALGAIALHMGGVALAYGYMNANNADDDLGAPSVEIGLELSAPHADPNDLPPGPESDASTASPEIAERQAQVDPTDLPKDTPTETDDPDRLVSPNATEKPKEDEPQVTAAPADPSTAAVAAEETAPPTSDTIKESTKSVAPVQGIGESALRVKMKWEKELAVYLNRHLRYPAGGARRQVEVSLTFTIDRIGHVLSTSILHGSGDPAFDDAALAMMHRADPVPPPPPLTADEGLTFTIPVVFRVKGHG